MPEPSDTSQPESIKHPSSSGSENKIFYGWWIAIGSMTILTISSGIGFFGHTLIFDALASEFGWSKGIVSSAITLFLLTTAAMGSIIGGMVDKYGPSPILIWGAVCTGTGFFLLSRIQALWQFYAVYLLIGIGMSGTYSIPISTLIANWFIKKRGRALSVAMTGLSLGGIIVVPLSNGLLQRWGLRATLPVFGSAFLVIIIPIALFIIKQHPMVLGLGPDGTRPLPTDPSSRETEPAISRQMAPWTRRQAMGTKAFWFIVLAFLLVLSGQVTFMIHQISFLSPILGPGNAALSLSIMSGTSFLGRLIMGSFIDQLDKRFVAIACFLLQGGAVFTIGHAGHGEYIGHAGLIYACIIAFGFTMGNILMMQSLIIGECFGMVSFGTVSGLGMLFTSAGSSFGPLVAGVLFDLTHSYQAAFSIFALAYVFAAVIIVFATPPDRPMMPHQGSESGKEKCTGRSFSP
jgi:MFS family permease